MMCTVFAALGSVGVSMCVLHLKDATRLGEDVRLRSLCVDGSRRMLLIGEQSRLFGSADRARTAVKLNRPG